MVLVKEFIIGWLIEIFRSIVIYLENIKVNIEADEYSKENKDINMKKVSPLIRRNLLHNQDIINKRWNICMDCEHLTETRRCNLCKCYMFSKVKVAKAFCPAGKWGRITNMKVLNGTTATN